MMKKNIMRASAAALAFCLLATAAPVANVDAAAKTKLNKKKITIKVGKTKKLKIKNLKGKKVKWKTSNKSVVKIKKTKKKTVVQLKGKKAGTATITARIGKKKYKCKVTVKAAKGNSSNKGSAREQEQARREQVEKQVDKKLTDAVNSVTTPQMKDQEKALRLAYYVCDNLGHFYGHTYVGSDVDSIRCIEGGKGTGLGYAEVYGSLLDKVGIENFWVPDGTGGGLRTKLKIDGQWYNVDVYRMDGNDEEIHSGNRQLLYGFFMFSDQEAFKYHSDYYKPTVDSLKKDYPDATSTRFDFLEITFNKAKAAGDVLFGSTVETYANGGLWKYNPWYTGEWINY